MWPFGSVKYEKPEVKNDITVNNNTLPPAVCLQYKEGDVLIFEHPTRLSDESFNRLKDQLDKMFVGKENCKSAIILENGMRLASVLNK